MPKVPDLKKADEKPADEATKTGSDDQHVDVATAEEPKNVFDEAEKPASVMNTTETEYADDEDDLKPRTRELSDKDRAEIKAEFNKPGAVIANIAHKFEIEPSEVFAIAEGK